MKLDFYQLDIVDQRQLKFAVISAIYKGKWVYVRHKDRTTWEIAGGHREFGENMEGTAQRELCEETGCIDGELIPICDYSLGYTAVKKYGRLYLGVIRELGQLPASEIDEIKLFEDLPVNLTYPEIQPKLFEKTLAFIKRYEQ
ncbi:NUDIX domain-containing protein [Bacillus infantis]|uniref:NUDIX hydrolase n=1 Tax=Bacillus infantis TaxID=324767 RepID=UPI003018C663